MARSSRSERILPSGLMVDGRPCLVVGGGKIAERKVGHLLDAGARVTVVASGVTEAIRHWTACGRIQHIPRDFEETDLDAQHLAFAVTNSETVNRHVLASCRARKILACSAGASWPEGDFMTPAILRTGGVILTVATGGASCRLARRVKDAVGRHIGLLDGAELMTLSATPVALDSGSFDRLGARLMQLWGVHEFALLETGGTLLVMGWVARTAALDDLLPQVVRFPSESEAEIVVSYGLAACRLLVVSVAGLCGGNDPFEDAVSRAVSSGWAGPVMRAWQSMLTGVLSELGDVGMGSPNVASTIDRVIETYRKDYEEIIRSA